MKNLKIKERWMSLSLREKRTVAAGIAAAIIFLCYLLIWSPVANKVEALRTQIQQDGKLLSWMQSANNRIKSLQQSMQPSTTSAKSILSIIQNEIKSSDFAKNLTTLRQVDAHSVQLNLQNVPFDNFITWLMQLSKNRGLQVTQMAVTPTSTQGIVVVEVILKG